MRHNALPTLCIVTAVLLCSSPLQITAPWVYPPGWDLMGYIGTVLTYKQGGSPPSVHARAYELVKQDASSEMYLELTGATRNPDAAWHTAMVTDAEAFTQQLPFYQARPVYPTLMYVLNTLGLDLVTAALVISKVAFLGLALMIYLWLSAYLRVWPACVLTMLVMIHQPILALANRPTPDSLQALCITAVFYLFLERRMLRIALALACLSILIRPGNLLLLLLLPAAMMPGRRAVFTTVLTAVMAGMAIYLIADTWSGNYSWLVSFYHSVIERLHYPADFQGGVRLSSLLFVYRHLAPLGQVFDMLWWWVLPVFLALCARYQLTACIDDWCRCLCITLLMMVLTWLASPFQEVADAGALVPYYLLTVVGVSTLLRTNPWLGTQLAMASKVQACGRGA